MPDNWVRSIHGSGLLLFGGLGLVDACGRLAGEGGLIDIDLDHSDDLLDAVATIRLFEAVTASGYVTIGGRESIVFEALNMPRSVQPARGTFGYTWEFREVFEDEYESWTELNPWA